MLFRKIRKKKDTVVEESEWLLLYQQSGDSRYIGLLFEQYRHLVYGVCLKYLKDPEAAADMLMVVFEKILHEETSEVRNFAAWVQVVTKNCCLMQLRKKKKVFQLEDSTEALLIAPENDLAEMETEEKIRDLDQAMKELPESQRVCLEQFYFQKKGYSEIASATGFETGKVKSYLQNGKRALKLLLEKKYGKL
jgi:RNA polymerase sigma-70 factor (ECF subfamily)